MGGDRRGSWGSYPDRSRLPQGYSGAQQKRGRGRQGTTYNHQGYSLNYEDLAAREQYEQARSRVPRSSGGQPGRSSRSRVAAIVVLVVVLVMVAVAGVIAGRGGGSGSGSTVSVSLLPFPQSTGTTATQ